MLGDTFLEVGADLIANVLLETADDQALVAEIFGGVVVGIADGRGVEQTHQRGKAARRAIVRRGRQQHHGVGTAREHAGQSGATRHAILVASRRHVVALINDDDVPPGVLEVIPVLKVVLEGIDRDDAAVEVVERVVIAGNVVANPRKPTESSRTKGMEKRLHHSFWNWVSMLLRVITRMRCPRPR